MNRHSVSNNVIKVTRTVTLKFSNQLSCIYRICFIYLIQNLIYYQQLSG